MRIFLEKAMDSLILVTARRIAAIAAVVGTLFTVGGTLTLADHYAYAAVATRQTA